MKATMIMLFHVKTCFCSGLELNYLFRKLEGPPIVTSY